MPRRPRIHFPSAIYHVILRGNARQDIFFHDQDRYRFFLLLQEGVERFGHSILAFCLMTNHVHLLCQVSEVPLSQIIQNLSFRYTRWINWRRNRVGHLFQGRYKAILVDADEYLLQLASYIHLNPIRANLVKAPVDYPWSSHRAYAGKERLPWLRMEPILSYFGGNLSHSRKLFLGFVEQNLQNGHKDEFSGGEKSDSRLLGGDCFREMIYEKVEPEPSHKPGITVVLDAVEKLYGLQPGGLATSDRSFKMAEARSMAAWGVREMSAASLTELGKTLNRDMTTLSSSIGRLLTKAKRDRELATRLEQLRGLIADFATLQA